MEDARTEEEAIARAESDPRTPRWVKGLGIVVLLVVVAFVVLQLAGVGGHHGPGRHL